VSRHQSRRRRTYGRRQHELHERKGRADDGRLLDLDDDRGSDDPTAFDVAQPIFELFSSPLRFMEGRG
jgi:hypothetical protein